MDHLRWKTYRRATLTDGPVGRVLDKVWNRVHDIEHALDQSTRDYYDAAHFVDGPAEKDAQAVIKKIEACVKELENISHKTFKELVDAEQKFVKEYGDPAKYSDQMRAKIFPR
jgi:hypothetical protein